MGHQNQAPTDQPPVPHTSFPWFVYIALVLPHCAPIDKPVSLDHVQQVPVIHHTEPIGPPELRITTHTDGLGWSVQPIQRIRRYVDVTQQETWKTRVYPAAKTWRIPKLVAGWVTCPTWGILGMTGLAFADPGAPMWRRPALYEPCSLAGGGEAYSFEATMMRNDVSLDRRIEEEDQPVTTGSLALVWQLPGKDPLGIDIPPSPQQPTITFRARWIANLLARQGIEISDTLSGHAEIQLQQPGGPLVSHPIPLTTVMLRTAIEQEAARAPAGRWPSAIRIRTVVEPDRNAAAPETRAIATHLLRHFARSDLAVVARDELLTETEDLQAAHHQGRYRDSAQNGIGEWSGATLLVRVYARNLHEQGYLATTSITSIETGEVLAHLLVEAPPGQWAEFLDTMSARILDTVMHAGRPQGDIAPHNDTRREGWLITQ
ncbi:MULTISPECIES: hypothetical protein [Nitrospira]|uniref:Uncharacterized protein n=2 Tax=Nitrospira TaxID=1234 RepID=A0AA86T4M2_9BACT|nr:MULTISPECIES: hypothetical protein [Nitrospira]CAE6733540.1 conserved hypothetical protein [Nitrospira defluvii]CAI4031666.1 hypothetical protein DNFV4_02085 [Nitrospira tepida]